MTWLSLSRVGWGAVVTWAVVSTGLLVAQRGRLLEQGERLEGLERAVSELRASQRPERAPPPPAGPNALVRDEARASGLSERELEALASRVAALLVARRSEAGTGPASEPRLMLAAEHQAAVQRANALLDEVLARGRLSREDVLSLRRELAPIEGTPEAESLRKRLAVALNQGQLVPDDPREPLLP